MKGKTVIIAAVLILVSICAMAQVEPPPGTKDYDVPGWVVTIIGWFANKWTMPVAFGALVLAIVQILRNVVALFGTQLGQKGIWIATAVLAFGAAFGESASDGMISGQEWVTVLVALASAVAACLGYRLLFSQEARTRLGK